MKIAGLLQAVLAFVIAVISLNAAFAEDKQAAVGMAEPYQLGLLEPATPIMESIVVFHDGLLLPLITAITLFILALLIWIIVRFNEKSNPTPSKTTHNTPLEVAWTVIPVIILIVIAVASFAILEDQETVPDGERKYLAENIFSRESGEVLPAPEVTVKAIASSWYWSYEYPDLDEASYDSSMIEAEDLEEGQPRLLTADSAMVVPVNTTVRVEVTATPGDVLHAFAVPSFGSRVDAVPGRINQTWFYVRKEGMYYGQCSELCGARHAFMPINVLVVSKEQYAAWSEKLKETDDIDEANEVLANLLDTNESIKTASLQDALKGGIAKVK